MILYKVMARVEDAELQTGEARYRWVNVRRNVPRGTGEAIAAQVLRDGFRLDADRGSTHYPAHRIALVEVISDDLEVTP